MSLINWNEIDSKSPEEKIVMLRTIIKVAEDSINNIYLHDNPDIVKINKMSQ